MKRLKKQCKSGCESAHGSIPRSFGDIDLLLWHLFSHILFSDIFDLRALTNNMAAEFVKMCSDGDLEGVRAALQSGVDVNSRDGLGETGLMRALSLIHISEPTRPY